MCVHSTRFPRLQSTMAVFHNPPLHLPGRQCGFFTDEMTSLENPGKRMTKADMRDLIAHALENELPPGDNKTQQDAVRSAFNLCVGGTADPVAR